MRVLVACEFSGLVRDAFLAIGHDACSCDLEPSERPGPHYQGDVRSILYAGWDLMIAFPPCTYLCNSGARWWYRRQEEQKQALDFVAQLLNAPIHRIALENPEGKISTAIRRPDQIIHPWQYGHEEEKRTCLWLKGLPHLQPTEVVVKREQRVWRMGQSKSRSKNRSRTYSGIAFAMAQQWGC
jgi:hypothetical protein